MPGDDLESVPGLQENHRRALADKLGITSLRALADADQRAVYTALGSIRPRPSLARIAAWQDDARSRLSSAKSDNTQIDSSAWHTAALFAVIFAQRQVNGNWEHRLEAEQTEVEPAPEPQQWRGWDCGPLCDWMLGQLTLSGARQDSGAGRADQAEAPAAAQPAASITPPHAARAELRIDAATIIDSHHELDLLRAGNVIAAPQADLSPPVRLRLTVSGERPSQQLRAAVWFRRQAEPGWSPQEPVIVPASGQAEFDLSSVPPWRAQCQVAGLGH